MTEAEQVMKRCQIGTRDYNEANNLHADCYRVIGKLLAEHAMREVQRLGQEIEQEQLISDQINYGMSVTQGGKRIDPMSIYKEQEQEQEPVRVPWSQALESVWAEQEPLAKYSDIVSDGGLDPRNKFDIPPQRTWVELTDVDIQTTLSQLYCDMNQMKFPPDGRPQKETVGFLFAKALLARAKEKNT